MAIYIEDNEECGGGGEENVPARLPAQPNTAGVPPCSVHKMMEYIPQGFIS